MHVSSVKALNSMSALVERGILVLKILCFIDFLNGFLIFLPRLSYFNSGEENQ